MVVVRKCNSVQSHLSKIFDLTNKFFTSQVKYKLDKNRLYLDKTSRNCKTSGIYLQKYLDTNFLLYPNDLGLDFIPIIKICRNELEPEFYYYHYTNLLIDNSDNYNRIIFRGKEQNVVKLISKYIFDYTPDSFKEFYNYLIVNHFIN